MGFDKYKYECLRAHQFAGPRKAGLQRNVAGFTNAELAIGVGLVALIMLLLQVQSGEISFGSSAAKPVATKSGKSSGKQPEFTYPQITEPVSPEAILFVEARQAELKADQQRLVEASRVVAQMEPKKAALMLSTLETAEAAAVLSRVDSHYIAQIFDAALHQDSALWLQELLLLPQYAPIPEQYRRAAEEAGLLDPVEGEALPISSDPVDGAVDDAGNEDLAGTETAPATDAANGGVVPEGQALPTASGGTEPGVDVA